MKIERIRLLLTAAAAFKVIGDQATEEDQKNQAKDLASVIHEAAEELSRIELQKQEATKKKQTVLLSPHDER